MMIRDSGYRASYSEPGIVPERYKHGHISLSWCFNLQVRKLRLGEVNEEKGPMAR